MTTNRISQNLKTGDLHNSRKDMIEWKNGLTTLYGAANIEISWDSARTALYCDWIGYQQQQELRLAGEEILALMSLRRCSKVLNDNTRLVGHWYHSVDWINSYWFPQMFEAGLEQFAWIFSDDIFTQLSARRTLPSNDIVRVFDDPEKALNWLTTS